MWVFHPLIQTGPGAACGAGCGADESRVPTPLPGLSSPRGASPAGQTPLGHPRSKACFTTCESPELLRGTRRLAEKREETQRITSASCPSPRPRHLPRAPRPPYLGAARRGQRRQHEPFRSAAPPAAPASPRSSGTQGRGGEARLRDAAPRACTTSRLRSQRLLPGRAASRRRRRLPAGRGVATGLLRGARRLRRARAPFICKQNKADPGLASDDK